ncbi:methyltransferase FkbM [Marivita lacus]|uniref:Methyltransferase FkbM n=1 Tax=Marivita lacus TaxID=1323742 RepID=A0ABQ1LN78_9RHOB|nr:methyltransferase FkbM [Marivita lacus]
MIKQLASVGRLEAFDVGANQGEWAQNFLECTKNGHVTCFEPVPTTFAALSTAVQSERATLVQLGMGDTPGQIAINSVVDNPHISSLYDMRSYEGEIEVEKVDVSLSTGDVEMAKRNVSHLNMLKIDAEGHDFKALTGFGDALTEGRIDVIQFEYNYFTVIARTALRDFYDLLEEHFLLCRLLPQGLEVSGFHHSMDTFAQANWIAVRKSFITPEIVLLLNMRSARGLGGVALVKALWPAAGFVDTKIRS